MESATREYVVRNSLSYAYDALRSKERLMGETTASFYEHFFHQLADSLALPGKRCEVSIANSEVESFYLGKISVGEFRLNAQKRVFSKIPGWDFAPLSSLVWAQCCSAPDKKAICEKVDTGVGRQIWEIFIYLDVESVGKIHIDDICDLVLRVLRENGHVESEQNIREWFCEEILIDFWSFFAAIVENYSGLLKPNIIRSLHELITTEVLLSGKLTKKGHKIHSWKERWFTLQPTQLSYYESYENKTLKGTIVIGAESQFEFLPDSKSHQRRFRLLDAQTQVPYEICTPDVSTLQQWNNGLKIAIAMNRVKGTNFLHRLTLAQKEVFPENTVFSISAINPSVSARSTSPNSHQPLVGSKSTPLSKPKSSPLLPAPYKGKNGSQLPHQKSALLEEPDGNLNGPPPIPPQRYVDTSSVVPRSKPRGLMPESDGIKSRRRHSSITGSSEYEKAMEKEQEKIDRVNVAGAVYSMVTKPAKNGRSSTPTQLSSPPLPPIKGKEVRRVLPTPPSPYAERKGYAQLQFQNGTSNMQSQNSTPVPEPDLPRDLRTRWDYSTVVFDSDTQKERELENGEGIKKNKPLPPPPGSNKSTSDSILAPQPAPRQKKPQSLTDVRNANNQHGSAYDNVDFSPTTAQSGAGKREPPRLPPKQDSLESHSHNKPLRPKPTPRQRVKSPSTDRVMSPSTDRVMSPSTEVPPPVPRRPNASTPT